MSAKAFMEKSKWIKGPDFLNEAEDTWLKEDTFADNVDPDSTEERHVVTEINVKDVEEAEVEIIKQVQNAAFPSGLKNLQDIQSNPKYGSRESDKVKKATLKKTSSLHTLDPFVDEMSIIRVGGRIRRASPSESLKNPIILPKSSNITSLVINHVHERTHHSGRGVTLNELRASGYWVINGNSMVRLFISKCVKCRYLRGTNGEQNMADLPKSRLEPAPPFTYCAVDYFGPWHVKQGISMVKRYGALFTCLASRVVHIEVADSAEEALSERSAGIEGQTSLELKLNSRKQLRKWMTRR